MKVAVLFVSICVFNVSKVTSEKGLCVTPCEDPEICEPCGEGDGGHHHCCRYPDGVRHWGKWCCYRYCQYGEVCVTEGCHLGSVCKWPWLVKPGETYEANSSAEAAAKEYLRRLESGEDTSASAVENALLAEASGSDVKQKLTDPTADVVSEVSPDTDTSAAENALLEDLSGGGENQNFASPPLDASNQASLVQHPWSSYTIVTTYDEQGNIISEKVIPPEGA